uniref:Uncharacterized protein n=1 Tax=Tanacetum cinerariifolium TaxID=118510 RepID=A0A699HWE1_TANCI|nr:hypothetical protein [Tanacetum cinerariifolium]
MKKVLDKSPVVGKEDEEYEESDDEEIEALDEHEEINDGYDYVELETQANDQDHLVNDNDNDDLRYESEVYLDEEEEGDLVREHIGLKILSWKKQYFDVDLIVRKLVMNRLGQLLRNFIRKLRQTHILPNQNTLSKLNEVPAKYSAILKAKEWVNFVKYTTTEEYQVKSVAAKMARSKSVYQHKMRQGGYVHVKQKMKETEDKIKEETLKFDHGTDAMTVVLGEQLQSMSTQLIPSDVSPMDINPIDNSADEEGGTPLSVVGCENDASIQKSNGLATSEKKMETSETVNSVGSKKTTKSLRKEYSRQDSQS